MALAVFLAGCAGNSLAPPQLGRDHALLGRIWDVEASRFVTEAELVTALAAADFVLLGEKHDNLEHHQLQARLVAAILAADRRPVVGFEMLTRAQAEPLAAYLAGRPRDAAGLGRAVGWEKSGWPAWSAYRPIADAALAAGADLVATNLTRSQVRRVGREGYSALDVDLVERTGLDWPLDPATRAALEKEIQDSHCGQAPEHLVAGMVRVQRARDAVMADTLVAAAGDRGGVQITGTGHARKDRGIPVYIARLRPDARIVSLAFREVSADKNDPAAYVGGDDGAAFDYLWFTLRVDDEDPCEKFEKQLERLRRKPA